MAHQLEAKRSPRHFSADRELDPLYACQPSTAAPRPRPLPVRAGLPAPPCVKPVQVVVYGLGGHVCLGLDARVVPCSCPHGRQLRCERD